VDKNRCDNRKDKTTPQLCTISHSVTTGYTTSVTTSASYGVKAGLKTKGTASKNGLHKYVLSASLFVVIGKFWIHFFRTWLWHRLWDGTDHGGRHSLWLLDAYHATTIPSYMSGTTHSQSYHLTIWCHDSNPSNIHILVTHTHSIYSHTVQISYLLQLKSSSVLSSGRWMCSQMQIYLLHWEPFGPLKLATHCALTTFHTSHPVEWVRANLQHLNAHVSFFPQTAWPMHYSYAYTSTDSQTQSKSTTDTVTVSKNVPPGECITLQLMVRILTVDAHSHARVPWRKLPYVHRVS